MNTDRRKLYTLGYAAGWRIDDIEELLGRLGGVLIDVRLSPRSRRPEFSRKRLSERLGARYLHVRQFGNVNYRGGPIEIQDIEGGMRRIEEYLTSGRPCVLMCACADVAVCHRLDVAKQIARRWPLQVVHLQSEAAGGEAERPGQPRLF